MRSVTLLVQTATTTSPSLSLTTSLVMIPGDKEFNLIQSLRAKPFYLILKALKKFSLFLLSTCVDSFLFSFSPGKQMRSLVLQVFRGKCFKIF